MIEVIPTVVPASFEDVAASTARYRGIAKTLQIDGADGIFAPNTTWLGEGERKLPDGLRHEAHIMVRDAEDIGVRFAHAGAFRIIGHVETLGTIDEARPIFDAWRKAGAKEVGVAILIDTPLESLYAYAPIADMFLLMCIGKIGTMGASFDEKGIERVRRLHAEFPDIPISVDGGVSEKTIRPLAEAGATIFSVGSALAKAPDPKTAYESLTKLATV